ncbi:MAG: tyrosine-type recombinase/integrase [Planctomycetes bacterium]|nr:tyrosine-type recombinase/integrase [Planctomycetota bacterium]
MPKKPAPSRGRKKAGTNRGYFYYAGRGWFTLQDGRKVALLDPDGNRIRERNTPDAVLREALARHLMQPAMKEVEAGDGPTVLEVVSAYLKSVEAENRKTFEDRSATLFDLCYGLPPAFRRNGKEPTEDDYIHDGLGNRPAAKVIPLDITQWLQAHPTWTSYRTRVQAVKRAFNYAVEQGLLAASPLRGMKVQKPNARVTYLTDEQEAALLEHAGKAFRVALRVLIRTGMRPGIEFAALRARHITDEGTRLTLTFQPHETKTKRVRVIRIKAPQVIKAIRRRVAPSGDAPLFRNRHGDPWTVKMLSQNFRRTLARARKHTTRDLQWDKDVCLYSCRHTYAKRTLQGYWSGTPTNIETLARLMGHTVQVCRDHYLQWTNSYDEPLWDAC